MNRATIRARVINYLNEQDTFSMPFKTLEGQFEGVGANFDVTLWRMEGAELTIEREFPYRVTLKEPFRKRRR
jgi:hypothetical protein